MRVAVALFCAATAYASTEHLLQRGDEEDILAQGGFPGAHHAHMMSPAHSHQHSVQKRVVVSPHDAEAEEEEMEPANEEMEPEQVDSEEEDEIQHDAEGPQTSFVEKMEHRSASRQSPTNQALGEAAVSEERLFDGAPECRVNMDNVYSCAKTIDEAKHITKHLNRRGVVAFTLICTMCLAILFTKTLFGNCTKRIQNKKHLSVMFYQAFEQITILGLIVCMSCVISKTDSFRTLDKFFFPDKQETLWDLSKFATFDMREGKVSPEIEIMFDDLHLLLVAMMIIYTLFMLVLGWRLRVTLRTWKRWELENENEIHVLDDPLEKVNFLLFRRSVCWPLIGQRPRELNTFRNPVQEFSFHAYLKEVTCQYAARVMQIPLFGLAVLVLIAAVECFIEMQTRNKKNSIMGMSLVAWSWALFGFIMIFNMHVRRVKRAMTPPSVALKWYLEHNEGEIPDKHILPPYRLVPFLKEAPRRNKFFFFWYGTFTPSQHEQLFFRWKNGPSTILFVMQNIGFIMAVIAAVSARTLFTLNPDAASPFFWFPLLSMIPIVLAVAWLLPDTFAQTLLVTSTGQMVNKAALMTAANEYATNTQSMIDGAIEATHMATIKEQLENNDTREKYLEHLSNMFLKCFTEDEQMLFKATWKVHNWDTTRGMNPAEVRACMEHLGMEDADGTVGEWWLMFDTTGSAHLQLEDFQRMVTAKHMSQYGSAKKEEIQKLFELVGPDGRKRNQYNRAQLEIFLRTLHVANPGGGSKILIREARFLADETKGLSQTDIILDTKDIDSIMASPAELAEFLFTKQSFRRDMEEDTHKK